jgi:hypothetical protein
MQGTQALTIGAGGITASASSPTTTAGPFLDLPITLGASEVFSIDGGGNATGVSFGSSITGAGTLGFTLSNGGFTELQGDVETGNITIGGSGSASDGFPGEVGLFGPSGGQLNGTDGNSVAFNDGRDLVVFGGGATGRLTMNGGTLDNGSGSANVLSVNGNLALNSGAVVDEYINGAGTTPGTDFSQLKATGAVSITSATLFLSGSTLTGACLTLHLGDVYDLITTTGSLTGTFSGVPDGTVIPVDCSGDSGVAPTVRINYTTNSVTATVVTPGFGATTTTGLTTSPSNPVSNQAVTLTATVTQTADNPTGTIEFDNNGAAVSGCASQPVGSAGTATCQTSLAAGSHALAATFNPSSAAVLGSTSPPDTLVVGKDTTSTALAVSQSSLMIGQSVTFSATVTPAHPGALEPSGPMRFLDGGSPIGSCQNQPLTAGGSSSTATCTLSFSGQGPHTISASYGGDGNFAASTSAPQAITVQPPITMQPLGATTPTRGQVLAALALVEVPRGHGARIGSLLKNAGFTFTFDAPSGGTLMIIWYFVPNGAHVGGDVSRAAKPVKIATGRVNLTQAGIGKIKVSLTSQGRQLLSHAKTLKITATDVFAPTGAGGVGVTKKFKLRR